MSLLDLVKRNAGPAQRLETAVADEDVATIRCLVSDGLIGVDAEVTQQTGLSALHLAARQNKPESVRTLVQMGGNPLLANYLGHTPLFCALHANAPNALLELARWAPIPWEAIRDTCHNVWAKSGPPNDPYLSFTMHLVVSLLQPLTSVDWRIVSACFGAYWRVVEATTEWKEIQRQPGLSRALFPSAEEEAAAVETIVSSSPFLLDERIRPEAILSATLGAYECSRDGSPAALRSTVKTGVSSALSRLLQLRERAINQSGGSSPQSLRFICRNSVRQSVNCRANYVYAVYSLPLDFVTKRFLTYQQEVSQVLAARPGSRYN